MRRFPLASLNAFIVSCSVCAMLCSGIVVAGDLDPQQSEWHKKYKGQENAPKPEAMLLNVDPEPELKTGFVSMFNGKDLTGWTSKGGVSKYTAKDGILTGTCVPGTDSTYLCTEKSDYTDFVFTCEMKWGLISHSGPSTQGIRMDPFGWPTNMCSISLRTSMNTASGLACKKS